MKDKRRKVHRVVMSDQVKRITVDGQTAILLLCTSCGTTTPHGRTAHGQKYCGCCGTQSGAQKDA